MREKLIELRPIFLVEDDEVDRLTVERALADLRVRNDLHFAHDGVDALAYLHDKARDRPALVLLDINMPRMNGIELLRVMKADEQMRRIPVVMLTTSAEDKDRLESFDLSVAGFMIKPVDYAQFVEVVRAIHLYWSLCELP